MTIRRTDGELPAGISRLIEPQIGNAFDEHSRIGRLPWLRDPMIQLTLVTAIFTTAVIGGLATPDPWGIALGVIALSSAFLGSIVLLRSVRHGWNVQSYGWARKATHRAATFRMESEALWSACDELAEMASGERRAERGTEILQSLVGNLHLALARSSTEISVVLVEETDGRFLVVCSAGRIRSKPHYVAPEKSCLIDRPFPELLRTFSPGGFAKAEEVRIGERRYWVGLASSDPQIPGAQRIASGLRAWVVMVEALGGLSRVEALSAG